MRKVNEQLIALETMEDLQGLAVGTRVEDVDAGHYYIVEEDGLHAHYEDYYEHRDLGLYTWEVLAVEQDYIDGWLYLGEFEDAEEDYYDPYGEY